MLNALTFDIEDWFHICDIEAGYSINDWDGLESRVENNTLKILKILKKENIKASFFVLGWVAERYPELIKEISKKGHEIASHGYSHKLVYECSPQEFRDDIRKSADILENIINQKIIGFRATGFSITKYTEWAFEILAKEGFKYDASVFPTNRGHGGISGAPIYPYVIETPAGKLKEFPNTVLNVFGKRIAFCGGGYFRLYPYSLIKYGIKKINNLGHSAIIYLHPRELDPEQPRMKIPWKRSFKYYVNLSRTEEKLKRLINDFQFVPVRKVLDL